MSVANEEGVHEGEAPRALPGEGATQAPAGDVCFEGEAPRALPGEGATQAPVIDLGEAVPSPADDDERNRFLTIAMGECWHDFDLGCPVYTCRGGGFICGLCRDFVVSNNDFAGEEDFPKLWEWAKSTPALREVAASVDESSFVDRVSRRSFADKVYRVLRNSRSREEVWNGESSEAGGRGDNPGQCI